MALVWAGLGGGGTLKANFAWAALLLLGVIAMTRNFIRGYARSLRRVPLEEAAADLHALLLYMGVVWGAGAFLVMPGLPAPALVFSFAAAPSLVLTLMLRDRQRRAGLCRACEPDHRQRRLVGPPCAAGQLGWPDRQSCISGASHCCAAPCLRRARDPPRISLAVTTVVALT